MLRFHSLFTAVTAVVALTAGAARADVITGWTFDSAPYVVGPTGQTVVSNLGALSGTGYEIGWNTSIANPGTTATYTYDTVNSAGVYSNATANVDTTAHPYNAVGTVTSQTFAGDVVSTTGGSITENTWRTRSGNSVNTALGFSRAAPQFTQGTQWATSTVGYKNISFSFDWFSTNNAVRDMQVQFSTDGNTWVNVGGTLHAAPNTFFGASTPNATVSLSAAADNQSYLAVRLVTAYDSTGNVADYASATLSAGVTQLYNNSSGNWRLDNLQFTGDSATAVPEPSSLALIAVAGGLFAGFRARRRKFSRQQHATQNVEEL